MTALAPARFNQVALSVSDRERSLAFYRDLFGLDHVGGTRFSGKKTERVQGMTGADSFCSWLMDDRPYFQLELFEFAQPRGKPRATSFSPWDVGYSRLIFTVPDISDIARRCGQSVHTMHGAETLFLHDPDNIGVQVIQGDVPRPRLTGVALTVPDMPTALRSYVRGCGCLKISSRPRDWGALWGENAADKDMAVVNGGTLQLEISRYRSPSMRSWPVGYVLADHGILNVALGFESPRAIKARLKAMKAVGFVPNTDLVSAPGLFNLTYSNDPQGFNVETLQVSGLAAGAFGFRKANLFDRALMAIMQAFAG